MKSLYLFFSTLSSLSLAAWIFILKKGWTINYLLKLINPSCNLRISPTFDLLVSGVVYMFGLIFIAWLTTTLFNKLDSDKFNENAISKIKMAGSELMMTYFGLFFYALSVSSGSVFLLSFIVLAIAIILTSRVFYNPLYIFLGYHFYNLEVGNRVLMMMSKKRFKEGDEVSFPKVGVINDFTYVDLNKS